MKSILITVVCMIFALLMKAQTADSVKTVVSPEIIKSDKIIPEDSTKEVFNVIDEFPEFPGGQEALMNYLATNINYPREAMETGIQGIVYVTFIVEADGSITNIEVPKRIGGGCDEEAIRVVQSMPKWKPGKQDGEPVRVSFSLPIRFILHVTPPTEKRNKSKK